MTLRIILLGLVASLGFEIPSGADVESWADAGKAWVLARMDDPSGPKGEAELGLDGPTDRQQAEETFDVPALAGEVDADADMAFMAMSEKMATDLSADLLASHHEEMPGEEVDPILALEGEEAGCLAFPAIDEGMDAAEAESDEVAEASPERLDRVSTAVRLTREAVQAWADLMQHPDEEAQPTR